MHSFSFFYYSHIVERNLKLFMEFVMLYSFKTYTVYYLQITHFTSPRIHLQKLTVICKD